MAEFSYAQNQKSWLSENDEYCFQYVHREKGAGAIICNKKGDDFYSVNPNTSKTPLCLEGSNCLFVNDRYLVRAEGIRFVDVYNDEDVISSYFPDTQLAVKGLYATDDSGVYHNDIGMTAIPGREFTVNSVIRRDGRIFPSRFYYEIFRKVEVASRNEYNRLRAEYYSGLRSTRAASQASKEAGKRALERVAKREFEDVVSKTRRTDWTDAYRSCMDKYALQWIRNSLLDEADRCLVDRNPGLGGLSTQNRNACNSIRTRYIQDFEIEKFKHDHSSHLACRNVWGK